MKGNDIVRFGIARTTGNVGCSVFALPQVLQGFGLRVFTEHIATEDDFRRFWNEPAVQAQVTVIACQGWGETAEEAVMNWPLLDAHGEPKDFALTPQNIHQTVGSGSGLLLSLSSWSGKRAFADGFFRAGFEHYVAPYSTSDAISSLQFATNLFSFLLWESRDYQPQALEVAEAVNRAREIDNYFDGAHGFRYFCSHLQAPVYRPASVPLNARS
jgi:hypothetical protein